MMLLPRVLIYKDEFNSQLLITIRWKGNGLDLLRENHAIFVQFGKNPVKFIYLSKKHIKPPTFLFSYRWRTKLTLGPLRVGTSTKPLDLTKPWRNLCKRDSDPSPHTATKEKINYGSGRARQISG